MGLEEEEQHFDAQADCSALLCSSVSWLTVNVDAFPLSLPATPT